MFGALAEFKRNLIRERTQAGLASARERRRMGDRPKALDDKKRKLLIKLYQDHTISELTEMFNISRSTLFKLVKQEKVL
jgi:DNA invertase Pin-like site-specific DNA recombinase